MNKGLLKLKAFLFIMSVTGIISHIIVWKYQRPHFQRYESLVFTVISLTLLVLIHIVIPKEEAHKEDIASDE